MFWLIKQVFIVLLKFTESLATSLDLYRFMISLDKFNRTCNAVGDWSTKICVQSETKNVDVKVCNMITKVNTV